ncbi:MAG: energy-coupling factor transporter transmembrane component T [Chloroflexota bacterium]
MLVTWKYRNRGKFLDTLDPRARWITSFLVLFSIIQFWDIRFMLFFFVLAMTQYFMTGLKWSETKRVWMFVTLLVVVIVGLNALLSGRGGPGEVLQSTEHIIWETNFTIPLVNWDFHPNITVNKLAFALTQIIRMLSSAVLFFIIPWTLDPRLYGVTFGGMGIPYRFAFSMDLAFRFVPSLARDFGITLDAQRARGYEIEKLEGGIFQMIRRVAPLIVPIVMNSIINGEDITNAMDLRCFGLEKRTWIEKLTYRRRDYAWIGFGAAIFVASLILNYGFNVGEFWVPEFMYLLAK